ncbi:hypothetical protein BJ170DRAFT_683667 [Xylariales sp. AK1849]|nr:hypothetical protein BJ170DRAFT_683667 [Xylariales sp. AK1849]
MLSDKSRRSGKEKKSSEKKPKSHKTDVPDIQWGELQQLDDGSWYREGYDQNDQAYEEYRANDDSIPRELSESFDTLSLHSGGSYDSPGTYSHSKQHADTSFGQVVTDYPAAQHEHASDRQIRSAKPDSKGKDKAKARDYPAEPSSSRHADGSSKHHKAIKNKGKTTMKAQDFPEEEVTAVPQSGHLPSLYAQHPTVPQSGYNEALEDEEDPALAAIIKHTKNLYHTRPVAGESSTSITTPGYPENPVDWDQTYGAVEQEDRAPTPTQKDVSPKMPKEANQTMIKAAPGALPGDYEYVDDRYRVEHSDRFEFGEVFKIIWSEPMGQTRPSGFSSGLDEAEFPMSELGQREIAGQLFYTGVRRFVVVGTDGGNSICVPILTYGRRGCKKGAKPEKHGIIYSPPHKPTMVPGEPPLGVLPVRLFIYTEGEKLAIQSRVNYSKHVTIEHNVKVLFIGSILLEDQDRVEDAVNKCWEDRIRTRHRQKRHQAHHSRR